MFQTVAKCSKCGTQEPCPGTGLLPKCDPAERSGWYWLKLPSGDEKLACSHGCFLLLATEEHEAVTKRLYKVKVTRADNAERFKKAVRA